ncbi:hypothetical protein SAICODRAFT_109284 [Saitoella complicata NRRL Y-17804]|uniref:uncharacterized protein n=1 Tax=Saitoella complicata (strain BCRC 22490 / CBS 7301 / JCM 7358 / NBRC 10748 / NRRL Y-17804) TaxID=698492 RepID=UPI000867309A|nr:uncharacterized protein SAICODRAFT_109284 [Saitoella complicata NRRL Y-17804]ODQ56475.1 hypothetical protein SAICODRAFT_109284 [Saitoella complicata NRRL Y-17804]
MDHMEGRRDIQRRRREGEVLFLLRLGITSFPPRNRFHRSTSRMQRLPQQQRQQFLRHRYTRNLHAPPQAPISLPPISLPQYPSFPPLPTYATQPSPYQAPDTQGGSSGSPPPIIYPNAQPATPFTFAPKLLDNYAVPQPPMTHTTAAIAPPPTRQESNSRRTRSSSKFSNPPYIGNRRSRGPGSIRSSGNNINGQLGTPDPTRSSPEHDLNNTSQDADASVESDGESSFPEFEKQTVGGGATDSNGTRSGDESSGTGSGGDSGSGSIGTGMGSGVSGMTKSTKSDWFKEFNGNVRANNSKSKFPSDSDSPYFAGKKVGDDTSMSSQQHHGQHPSNLKAPALQKSLSKRGQVQVQGKAGGIREEGSSSDPSSSNFRDIVDDLRLKNQRLRARLKKMEKASMASVTGKQSGGIKGLVEVRLGRRMSAKKRAELEELMRGFVANIDTESEAEESLPASPDTEDELRMRQVVSRIEDLVTANKELQGADTHGWVYLNIITNLAHLHLMNVTLPFVRAAVEKFSTRLELSEDGGMIRGRMGVLERGASETPSLESGERSAGESGSGSGSGSSRGSGCGRGSGSGSGGKTMGSGSNTGSGSGAATSAPSTLSRSRSIFSSVIGQEQTPITVTSAGAHGEVGQTQTLSMGKTEKARETGSKKAEAWLSGAASVAKGPLPAMPPNMQRPMLATRREKAQDSGEETTTEEEDKDFGPIVFFEGGICADYSREKGKMPRDISYERATEDVIGLRSDEDDAKLPLTSREALMALPAVEEMDVPDLVVDDGSTSLATEVGEEPFEFVLYGDDVRAVDNFVMSVRVAQTPRHVEIFEKKLLEPSVSMFKERRVSGLSPMGTLPLLNHDAIADEIDQHVARLADSGHSGISSDDMDVDMDMASSSAASNAGADLCDRSGSMGPPISTRKRQRESSMVDVSPAGGKTRRNRIEESAMGRAARREEERVRLVRDAWNNATPNASQTPTPYMSRTPQIGMHLPAAASMQTLDVNAFTSAYQEIRNAMEERVRAAREALSNNLAYDEVLNKNEHSAPSLSSSNDSEIAI